MNTMFDQFETDPVLESEGIWIDYGAFRVKIARAGGANKKYLSSECPLAADHVSQGVEILGGKPGDQLHPIQIFARAYGLA